MFCSHCHVLGLRVQVIVLNVMFIALSSTTHTAGVVPYLALFLLLYTVEVSLRVLSEDIPGDFWYAWHAIVCVPALLCT